jgi:hypothetical protein
LIDFRYAPCGADGSQLFQCGGEELGEQLRDALVLVVVDPVRRIGKTLDAVEVRHVIVSWLG